MRKEKAIPIKRLPHIRCKCGVKLVLLDDLDKMGLVIQAHASEHRKLCSNPWKAEEESNRVQDLLIREVFKMLGSAPEPLTPQ